MSAARYLGCNPWDLADESVEWIYRASAAAEAENHAQEMEQKRASK